MPSFEWNDETKKVFDQLSAIVDRMLQKQEAKRYPTMRDVAAEMQSLLIDLREERHWHFDSVELIPVDKFVEMCNQVNFKAPSALHGCLILQIMVSQARLQLSRSIDHVWESLFDIFHNSVDRGEIHWMEKAVEQIDVLVNQLIAAMRVVLLAFSRTESGANMKPRFGGRLQWLLSRVKDHLNPLIHHKIKCEKLLKECQAACSSDNRPDKECDSIAQATNNATIQVLQLWDIVSEMQQKLAVSDFDLAVYTMRLRRALTVSK